MIRKATIFDTDHIVPLWRAMQDEISLSGRSGDITEAERYYYGLISRLPRKDWMILVAEQENKIIGFIQGNVQYYEYGISELVGICDHVYVLPKYRGNRIGLNLINELISWGKSMGAKSHEFVCRHDEKTIKRYMRLGYTPFQVSFRKEL